MSCTEELLRNLVQTIISSYPEQNLNGLDLVVSHSLSEYTIERKTYELMNINTEESMQMLKTYLACKKLEGLSDRTLKFYEETDRKFLLWVNKPIQQITTNDIRMYLAVQTCGDVAKNNILRNIRTFFGWLRDEEYITTSPAGKLKQIKVEKVVKKPFSEMEVELFRENTGEDKRLKAVIEFLLSTGCRVGEIHRINIEDVKDDSAIVKCKGNKQRIVYLNAKSRLALQEYLETRVDDNPALFVSMDKPYERLGTSWFEKVIREYGKSLGIKNAHPHRFRRTVATHALNKGMPIEQVQKMLGHSQIDTTLIYAQTSEENFKMAHKKYVT